MVQEKVFSFIEERRLKPYGKRHIPFLENDFRIYVRNFTSSFWIKTMPFIHPEDILNLIDNLLLFEKYETINELNRIYKDNFIHYFCNNYFPLTNLIFCDPLITDVHLTKLPRVQTDNLHIKIRAFLRERETEQFPRLIYSKIWDYYAEILHKEFYKFL